MTKGMLAPLAIGALLISALGLACGSDPKSGFDDGSSGTSGGFGSKGGFDTDAGDVPGATGCSEAAKLVYVVSQEYDLYSFTPNTTTFAKLGRLSCPSNVKGAQPNSMAIDREGTAWVNYDSGELFKVSTADASCTATGFQPNQAGFLKFGMAFASNASGSTDETLYISGINVVASNGAGLGTIDLKTMKLTMIGDYSGNLKGQGAELTGTGDGQLFGFFTTQPYATVAEINKTSAVTSNDKSLQGVSTGNAWAFSFWGGDFWFYTSDGNTPSKVTQLKASSTGDLTVAKSDVGGFRIVGAGVSTCAPVAPPK